LLISTSSIVFAKLHAAVCTLFSLYADTKEQRNTEETVNTCRLYEVLNERDAKTQARNVPGLPDKGITRLWGRVQICSRTNH